MKKDEDKWVTKGPLTGFRCLYCRNCVEHELTVMAVRIKCRDYCIYIPQPEAQEIAVPANK